MSGTKKADSFTGRTATPTVGTKTAGLFIKTYATSSAIASSAKCDRDRRCVARGSLASGQRSRQADDTETKQFFRTAGLIFLAGRAVSF